MSSSFSLNRYNLKQKDLEECFTAKQLWRAFELTLMREPNFLVRCLEINGNIGKN